MAGSARRIVVEFIGDGKNLSGELNDLQGKTGKFGSFMKSAGKAAAYGLGAGLVVAGGAALKFAEAAAKDQQSAELMATAFRNNAKATDAQIAATEDWITAQGKALGVADDDLRPALSRLVTATHDVGKAQKLAALAMDVSAGSGKSLESVSTALMKAQNGQVSALSRLGINTKNAAGETITMEQAVARMSDTFGGAAADKADTFQGKMDKLKLVLSEAGESIGYKLMPVAEKLADWITGTAIPAVEDFTAEWEKGVGTGGEVRDILEKIGTTVKNVAGFLWDHKEAVAAVAAAYVAYKATMVAVGVVQGIQLALLKAHTVGTVENTVVTKVAAAASKAWAAAQWLLNAAMSANPITLVVIGLAALAAGLVIAYKKSETFRDIVKGALEAVGKVGIWLWNEALQPAFKFIVGGIGWVIEGIADLLGALGHIPGFGWAKDAADKMHAAADKAKEMANNIRDIPTSKTVTITVNVNRQNKNEDMLGPTSGRLLSGKGGGSKDDPWGLGPNHIGNPGAALVNSIVKGIETGKVKLQGALDKLGEYIKKHQDKLADLLSKRDSIVEAFRGMTSSIFSTDLAPNEDGSAATIQRLLDAGATRRVNAEALAGNVQTLLSKGLSKDLLQQMIDAGQAGADQIALLASGTQDQINQANADNDATRAALEKAGLAVGDAIFGTQIAQEEANLKLADTIKGKLQELLDLQDKNTIVELHLDGQKIYVSLKKLKKQLGHPLDI